MERKECISTRNDPPEIKRSHWCAAEYAYRTNFWVSTRGIVLGTNAFFLIGWGLSEIVVLKWWTIAKAYLVTLLYVFNGEELEKRSKICSKFQYNFIHCLEGKKQLWRNKRGKIAEQWKSAEMREYIRKVKTNWNNKTDALK